MKNFTEKFESLEKEDISMYFWVCYESNIQNISGDNDLEDTPVPIPNTEVKL